MLVPHPPLNDYYGEASKREGFVRTIFDDTAPWYDRTISFMSFGSGDRYRREAVLRNGLQPGMTMLDVASGTGVVARAALEATKNEVDIVALDPSIGMMLAGRTKLDRVQAKAESLPVASQKFDFLTIGFALRHFADLRGVFEECLRVLKPGGRLLVLELTAPRSAPARAFLGLYLGRVVPFVARVRSGNREAGTLMRYYWDTIRTCVRPEAILQAMGEAGFADVKRHVELGIFSEYSARRP
ncbi:MAG TPA: class I SAM-dependent methyltransferase [Thermoanaerobaculia bacterium]|jgi:demethylmenaquinone methyltransferase/2-methoxy-6-polyprenyl-1,4-benzoquinol methylase